MTSSSNNNNHGNKGAGTHARFIPREELQGFAAWTPGALGAGAGTPKTPEPPAPPTPQQIQAELHAARQSGYQDGYRDGLVALDGFKQSFAKQMSAQIGDLLNGMDADLAALEQQMAQALARTATELARQVVRSELATRPELVAKVAEDAVNAVLMSARHIRLTVHPDDQLIVAHGAAEALASRDVRLSASDTVARGGCLVESDVGTIDARIETRWAQAAATLGHDVPFADGGAA